MSDIINRARKLRAVIEESAQNLEPAKAVEVPELFPAWNGNFQECKAGAILRYGDTLYKVLVDHTTQPDWPPDQAVSLFAKVLTDPTGNTVQPWVQPDSTNPYMTGDKVTHNGEIWVSTIDNNVWEPSVYGWVIVDA